MKTGRHRKGNDGFLESRRIVHSTIIVLFERDREYPSIRKLAKIAGVSTATAHASVTDLAKAHLVRLHSTGGYIAWAGLKPEVE